MPRRPAADRPWTEEERVWARECLDAGDTVAEVASWADRRRADVRREFGVAGSSAPDPDDEPAPVRPGARRAEVARRLRAGERQADVARALKITPQRVSQIAKALRVC